MRQRGIIALLIFLVVAISLQNIPIPKIPAYIPPVLATNVTVYLNIGSGSGTLCSTYPGGGVYCASTSFSVVSGTSVTFSAVASSGYIFQKFTVNGANVYSNPYTNQVIADYYVYANFAQSVSFDFSISMLNIAVTQGQSVSTSVTINLITGNTQTVTCSASQTASPAGTFTTFSPTSGQAGFYTISVVYLANVNTPAGTYQWSVTCQQTSGGGSLTHTTYATLTINQGASFNYSISISPTTINVNQGSSTSATVTLTLTSGSTTAVSLSISGLPSGASGSFSPTSCNPSCTSTLTITTSSSTPVGTYSPQITSSGGGKTYYIYPTLNITSTFNFSMSAPTSITAVQGSSGSITVTVTLTATPTQSVSLGLSFSPSTPTGVTWLFSPTSGNPTFTSTLTMYTTSLTSTGSYIFTLVATGGSITRTQTVTLIVNPSIQYYVCIYTTPTTSTFSLGGATVSNGQIIPIAISLTLNLISIPPTGYQFSTWLPTGGVNIASSSSSSTTVSFTANNNPTCIGNIGVTYTLISQPFDFSINLAPSALTIPQGSSGISTVSFNLISGASQYVSIGLTFPGTSTGLQYTTSVNGCNPTCTITLTILTASPAAGIYSITVSGTGGSQTHSAVLTLTVTVNPTFDFSISATNTNVQQGQIGTSTVTITLINSPTQTVTITWNSADFPINTGISIIPSSGNPTFTATLSMTTNYNTPAGTYIIHVTGSSSGPSHTTTFTFIVTAQPVWDFSVAVASQSVVQASSSSQIITLTRTLGTAQSVDQLSLSGLPTYSSYGFSPTGCLPTCSSTLVINAGGPTPSGVYTITLIAFSSTSGVTHSSTFTLTVSQQVNFGFSLTIPTSTVVTQGGSVDIPVIVNLLSGSAQTVTLSIISGLPTGTTYLFTPASESPTYSSTLTITTTQSTPAGTYYDTEVKAMASGGLTYYYFPILIVISPFDFSLSVDDTITVQRGSSGSNIITAMLLAGPTQGISLSLTGIPAGVTWSFSAPNGNPTFASTLTIYTNANTQIGTWTITVYGTGGGLSKNVGFNLEVDAASNQFDFGMAAGDVIIQQGASGVSTIQVNLASGTPQTITLSYASGLPAGVTFNFNPASGTPTFTSTLTIYIQSSTIPGMYTVSITATAASIAHTVTFTLTVMTVGSSGLIGYNIIGNYVDSGGTRLTNTIRMFKFSSSSSFYITTIYSYFVNIVPASNVACSAVVYSDTGSNYPNSKLVESQSISVGNNGWTAFPIASTSIISATYYWIGTNCAMTANNAAKMSYDSGVANQEYILTGAYVVGSSPASFPSGALGKPNIGSIYATGPGQFAFDFVLTAGNITVLPGQSGITTVTVTLAGGTPESVSLAIGSGLPITATTSFSVSSGTPSYSSILTINIASSSPSGTYLVGIIGTSPNIAHTVIFKLTINSSLLPYGPPFVPRDPIVPIAGYVFNNAPSTVNGLSSVTISFNVPSLSDPYGTACMPSLNLPCYIGFGNSLTNINTGQGVIALYETLYDSSTSTTNVGVTVRFYDGSDRDPNCMASYFGAAVAHCRTLNIPYTPGHAITIQIYSDTNNANHWFSKITDNTSNQALLLDDYVFKTSFNGNTMNFEALANPCECNQYIPNFGSINFNGGITVSGATYNLYQMSQSFGPAANQDIQNNDGKKYIITSGIRSDGTSSMAWNTSEANTISSSSPFDFGLAYPESLSVSINKGDYKVENSAVTLLGCCSTDITLALSQLPSGISIIINPTTKAPPFDFTLTINVAGQTAAGSYQLTLTGAAGNIIKSTTFTVTVVDPSGFNFGMITPVYINTVQGEGFSTLISIESWSLDTDTLALTAQVPSGVTYNFIPSSAIVPFSAYLIINIANTANSGTYQLNMTGTGQNTHVSKTKLIYLNIFTRTFTFSITVSQDNIVIPLGSTGQLQINVNILSGMPASIDTVMLSAQCSNAPCPDLSQFSTSNIVPPFTASMTLTIYASNIIGTSTITINGQSFNGQTASASFTLTTVSTSNINTIITPIGDNGLTSTASAEMISIPYTPTQTMSVYELGVYINSYAQGARVTMALYTDNNGSPGTFITQSNTGNLNPPQSNTWLIMNTLTKVTVIVGNPYWLVIQIDSPSVTLGYSRFNYPFSRYCPWSQFGSFPTTYCSGKTISVTSAYFLSEVIGSTLNSNFSGTLINTETKTINGWFTSVECDTTVNQNPPSAFGQQLRYSECQLSGASGQDSISSVVLYTPQSGWSTYISAYSNGNNIMSDPISVYPSNSIKFIYQSSNCNTSGACDWSLIIRDISTSTSSSLIKRFNTNFSLLPGNNFDIFNVQDCSYLPPDNTVITLVSAINNTGANRNTWTGAPQAGPFCSVHTFISNNILTIIYGSATSIYKAIMQEVSPVGNMNGQVTNIGVYFTVPSNPVCTSSNTVDLMVYLVDNSGGYNMWGKAGIEWIPSPTCGWYLFDSDRISGKALGVAVSPGDSIYANVWTEVNGGNYMWNMLVQDITSGQTKQVYHLSGYSSWWAYTGIEAPSATSSCSNTWPNQAYVTISTIRVNAGYPGWNQGAATNPTCGERLTFTNPDTVTLYFH